MLKIMVLFDILAPKKNNGNSVFVEFDSNDKKLARKSRKLKKNA